MRSIRPIDTTTAVLPSRTALRDDPGATQKLVLDAVFDGNAPRNSSAASVSNLLPADVNPAQLMPHRRLQVVAETATAHLPLEVATLLEEQANIVSERILCHDVTAQTLAGDNRRELPRYGGGGGRGPSAQAARCCVIGVTSAIEGEGKTTAAMHIALSVARNSFRRVCLIDMGLGDDEISRRMNLGYEEGAGGLTDLIETPEEHDAAAVIGLLRMVRLPDYDNLVIVPGGRAPERPARAAHSPWLPEILNAVRERFDVVIVDMPSVASGNALPLLPHLNGVVMVIGAGATPREVVDAALDRVGRANVLGAILNGTRSHLPSWMQRRAGKIFGQAAKF